MRFQGLPPELHVGHLNLTPVYSTSILNECTCLNCGTAGPSVLICSVDHVICSNCAVPSSPRIGELGWCPQCCGMVPLRQRGVPVNILAQVLFRCECGFEGILASVRKHLITDHAHVATDDIRFHRDTGSTTQNNNGRSLRSSAERDLKESVSTISSLITKQTTQIDNEVVTEANLGLTSVIKEVREMSEKMIQLFKVVGYELAADADIPLKEITALAKTALRPDTPSIDGARHHTDNSGLRDIANQESTQTTPKGRASPDDGITNAIQDIREGGAAIIDDQHKQQMTKMESCLLKTHERIDMIEKKIDADKLTAKEYVFTEMIPIINTAVDQTMSTINLAQAIDVNNVRRLAREEVDKLRKQVDDMRIEANHADFRKKLADLELMAISNESDREADSGVFGYNIATLFTSVNNLSNSLTQRGEQLTEERVRSLIRQQIIEDGWSEPRKITGEGEDTDAIGVLQHKLDKIIAKVETK